MGSSIYHHHSPYLCPNIFPHIFPYIFPNVCLRTESYSLFSDKSRFGYFFRVVPSDYFQAKVHPKNIFNIFLHRTIKQFNNQVLIYKRTREFLIIVLLIVQQFNLSRFPHLWHLSGSCRPDSSSRLELCLCR